MSCKHTFIPMDDGSLDKICTQCGLKAKQGVLYFSGHQLNSPLPDPQPNLSPTFAINTVNNMIGRVEVPIDKIEDTLRKRYVLMSK